MNGRDEQNPPPAEHLTPREGEVLVLIGNGKTNCQIAEEPTFALSTVKWYMRQIYSKLNRWQTADELLDTLIKIT